MTQILSKEFIQALPKTDLHLHLDGSLRIPTLIELAKEYNVPLPSYTEEGLKESVFKERYANLAEYLHGFKYTVAVLQTAEALERVSYELACDNFAEGVRYIEVRFAPQLHCHTGLSLREVLLAVNDGLLRAKKEFNVFPNILSGKEPPFDYGIIVCAMRMFAPSFSNYFRRFCDMHPNTKESRLFGLASSVLAESIIALRDNDDIPIVSFDLAGREDGYPAEDHVEAYQYVHKNFLQKTVHAGEAYGPESIFQAITDLYANRIGHGYHIFSKEKIKDPALYVQRLSQYIANSRVTLEVCLTSNLQTMPELESLADHSFKKMLEHKLSVTLCTDNRLISNTTVTNEISLAIQHFHLSPRDVRKLIIYGFKRSFYPQDYAHKRAYVRQIIDYYESVEKKFGVDGKDKTESWWSDS